MVLFIVIPACRESFFKKSDMDDAIIIGAGIGGLVCGCYLAKAGMKVLIAEQHYKPGGYCTSFKRNGFIFDAAAHSFGGYREDGIVRKVFEDLGIDKRVEITRFDPSDIIITPDYKVSFWTDLDETINDFQTAFPEESNNVKNFFNFLINPDTMFLARMRSWTFKNLIDKYFRNYKLKAILSFPIFGNGALPPSKISAFIGAKIFTEFLIDGGYYPVGGMQTLSNALAESFKEYGGELQLSSPVKKIKVINKEAKGVFIKNGEFIASKYVISSCDARQTFINLLGKKMVDQDFLNKLNHMIPSLSMFVLYLGMDKNFNPKQNIGSNIWYLPHYSIEKMYLAAANRNINNLSEYMVRISSDKKSILAFINTSCRNKIYWINNKNKLIESFITKLTQIIPDISKNIIFKDAATPYTLYRYTLNYRGAAYGWASTPSQLADPDFRKPSFIQGLYLTGHWSTQGLGIPGVTYLGYNTANLLIKKEKTKK